MKNVKAKYTSKPELVNAKTNRARAKRKQLARHNKRQRGMNPQHGRKS